MSADAGEIVVCNAVFRLSISCSIPKTFAIEVRSRPKSRQKSMFFGSKFFSGGPPILDLVFKIAPISDHVAKFRGDRLRDRGDLALKKKRKKERAAKRKGSRVALLQRAALSYNNSNNNNGNNTNKHFKLQYF